MKIAKSYVWISITAILCFEILISSVMAATDLPDVMALQDLYRTLGYPPQLRGWRSDGGDPCVESWTGISCNGTAVRLINLAGLDLGGTLGWQLNLPNLWQLDLSFNHIEGEIPGSLPLNITYIDLSSNKFSMNIPYSLAFMKHLRYLNLSHNSLSGPVSNLFGDLQILKQMDLSYNSFIGDLPSSFGNLTNLTALYLQYNNFTGSVTFLENLQLTDLNIQNNNFSGVLPKQFQRVPNLWIWGNAFQFGADFPPWDFPQNNIPTDQNINGPPRNELNALESYPRFGDGIYRKKRFSLAGIACGVVCALVAACAAILFAVQIERARALCLKDLEGGNSSLPVSTKIDLSSAPEEFFQSLGCTFPSVLKLLLQQRVLPSASICRSMFIKMAKVYIWTCIMAFVFFDMLISTASAATRPSDVIALQDLYRNLGYPSQLRGWRSEGGDPCGESWTGISCKRTSISLINLAGLDLGGTLGWQLNLPNLLQLDLSSNSIQGVIPRYLPLNITYIDLSSNQFSMNIPYSFSYMKHLLHLNLSHNLLSGPINDLFGDLQSLREMDLSFNSFTGNVPHSMGSLMDLTTLHLEANNFSGSVGFFNNIILRELNFEGNDFDHRTCPNDFYHWSMLHDIPETNLQSSSSSKPNVKLQYTSPPKPKYGLAHYYILGFIVMGVMAAIYMRWRAQLRGWEDDMLRVTVQYEKCNGDVGEIHFRPRIFGRYVDYVRFLCQLVYGPLIGKMVAMDYLSQRGLDNGVNRDLLNQFIPLGQYSLEVTWCPYTNTSEYIALTHHHFNYFRGYVRVIRVRATGPRFQIVSVPWLPPIQFF